MVHGAVDTIPQDLGSTIKELEAQNEGGDDPRLHLDSQRSSMRALLKHTVRTGSLLNRLQPLRQILKR